MDVVPTFDTPIRIAPAPMEVPQSLYAIDGAEQCAGLEDGEQPLDAHRRHVSGWMDGERAKGCAEGGGGGGRERWRFGMRC